MTASEQATLNFYKWDYKYRGYYLFETPVDIEPPYRPFYQSTILHQEFVDDGHAPSIFKQIGNLLTPTIKAEKTEEEEMSPLPSSLEDVPLLIGFSVRFSQGEEINALKNRAFLNMLSYSHHPISFEIQGTENEIIVQFVCDRIDKKRVESQLKAYFPSVVITPVEIDNFGFDKERNIAICDFGVSDEFIRPIATTDAFSIDPLTSVIATLESLRSGEIAILQILFKGITSPLATDIPYSVSDGRGGSFFEGAPEMISCAKEKVESALYSVVLRIASQGNTDNASQNIATELARNITKISQSSFNSLIPLSNEGYSYDFHEYNLHHRLSNRFGIILNTKELNTFIHYPNKTVVSNKLGLHTGKTKKLSNKVLRQKYLLGINRHNGVETEVTFNDEMRLRHTHIIGATGVGKSTLIAQMMIEDMKLGNGCALFDPHGDIVEDILLRIPEHRKQDVIVIDPSNENYSIGFNLLGATTDAEKIVLSSDLVSSFKRHATAWGDNMSAVLSNAINTFLESSRSGTLIELKRFLLEDTFRKEFLNTVEDPSIHYYWDNEYHLVRKGIAPLLTRIDTFLRPKVIRYMLAQTGGINFSECIEQKKIVLIKLSQGLIGEENSFLLGSIFLSKFNQVAQGRQSLPKPERHPYYIYLDEFQNFITPSITRILSGARKYGLGLILAHQELGQIDDTKILNSVISNPYTRICFRLGDSDAKRLESGFSYFEQSNLQSLDTGQAIMKVGSSSDDFNVTTFPLEDTNTNAKIIKDIIIENTHKIYAKTKAELDELLIALLPKNNHFKKEVKNEPIVIEAESKKINDPKLDDLINGNDSIFESVTKLEKQQLIKKEELSTRNRDHIYLQTKIKKLGQERGYLVTIEKELPNRQRIDVTLEKDTQKIAFEVAINNKVDYELNNIKKCLSHGYNPIIVLSKSRKHLNNIKQLAVTELSEMDMQSIKFIQPKDITHILDGLDVKTDIRHEIVKGFRITTQYEQNNISTSKNIREHITKLLFKKR